jgi:hypothetical protein
MNRLTEAFLKYNFMIKYKKGSEMPSDFLSRNAIDAMRIFSDDWKLKQEQDEFCRSNKNTCIPTNKPVHANIWKLQTHSSLMEEYCGKESHNMVNKK